MTSIPNLLHLISESILHCAIVHLFKAVMLPSWLTGRALNEESSGILSHQHILFSQKTTQIVEATTTNTDAAVGEFKNKLGF